MKLSIVVLSIAVAFSPLAVRGQGWQPATGHTRIPIWPGAAPHAGAITGPETVGTAANPAGKPWTFVSRVSSPTITIYPPTTQRTGAAVVVFPGGGYQVLAIDLEGTEACDWLTSRGITCVLLAYRVPNTRTGPYGETTAPLEDAQRAISLVRSRAAEWGIDPRKIGVMGFSAGGHLVAATSTRWTKRTYAPVDAHDNASSRPDFAIALYPGHLWSSSAGFTLNPHVHVTKDTPPTFIVQAVDDPVDPVDNSVVYYRALQRAGVPVELHLFAKGGHAFGVRPTTEPITHWPRLAEQWLRTIGIIGE